MTEQDKQLADEVSHNRQEMENRWRRWEPITLDQRYDAVTAMGADRPSVITDEHTYSYQEMADWSRALARGLVDLGVHPGDHVALLIDNRPEFIAARLAVSRVGAVAAPLNFQFRRDEVVDALNYVEAKVLITIDASIATNFLTILDEVMPGWEQGAQSPRLPYLEHVALVEPYRPHALNLAELVARGEHVPESEVLKRGAQTDPNSVADIIFTSGTSGRPLAAELTHDGIQRDAYGVAYHRALRDGSRTCFSLPMYHVFGYIAAFISSTFVRGAIVPRRVFNPVTMLNAIQQHKATDLFAVPTMTVALVNEAARGFYDLSSLESIISAAAPSPVWLWEKVMEEFHPHTVFTGYGQTELSAGSTVTLPGDPLDVVAGTVGTLLLGGIAAPQDMNGVLFEYQTLDHDTRKPLPTGQEGELWVRGPSVTKAYHNSPEHNGQTIKNGWLRSGDLGRFDSDGYLHLTGRAWELYKSGGENVAPKEIEDVLTSLPGVGQAFVAGVPDERMGQVGWAWVVPDGTAQLSEHELIHDCHLRLAPFKVPKKILFTTAEELPLSSTGKVQKFRLVESVTQ